MPPPTTAPQRVRESLETRYYTASLDPDPTGILAATRAHWGVESFHWTLDVTFDEDHCRTRKDASAPNFAVIRHAGYNILGADRSRGSLHRKRLRASLDPTFRTKLFFERREQHLSERALAPTDRRCRSNRGNTR